MCEPVRLVIWDLDETFWQGTVTEGGHIWNEHAAATVRQLARRGIISAICSKNDPDQIDGIMKHRGFDEFFVFNSVSWDAKGPRLAAMISAIQLRPNSVLFIDDNPGNRAEAAHFVPGLQIADESIVPHLLDDPRCAGKPDPEMTRLAQYRTLDRRHRDQAQTGGDTAAFLRDSRISVHIEHDLGAHLDRVIELINRTNQLNFTKQRLPEDGAAARDILTRLLAEHNVQAGLLSVRDRYGDYGYCGLYIMRTHRQHGRSLIHFTFSCRILGMGVETWLYRRLERPALKVVQPVLTDLVQDDRDIDWIDAGIGQNMVVGAGKTRPLAYVLARGGCDMRAISHYFAMVAERVIEEFDTVRNGQTPAVNHSLVALQAMGGIADAAIRDFAPFGFVADDFQTALAGPLPNGPAVWLFGFAVENKMPIFRHRETGALLPASLAGLGAIRNAATLMDDGPYAGGVDPALVTLLRDRFSYEGVIKPSDFTKTLTKILSVANPAVRIFIMLANTRRKRPGGSEVIDGSLAEQNSAIEAAAASFANVETISPLDFMTAAEADALQAPHHYDRMVYFRIFQHIMQRVEEKQSVGDVPSPQTRRSSFRATPTPAPAQSPPCSGQSASPRSRCSSPDARNNWRPHHAAAAPMCHPG